MDNSNQPESKSKRFADTYDKVAADGISAGIVRVTSEADSHVVFDGTLTLASPPVLNFCKTLYLVISDEYLDEYGSDFHIRLVTMDEMKAVSKYLELTKIYGIEKVMLKQAEMNEECDVVLGGYQE